MKPFFLEQPNLPSKKKVLSVFFLFFRFLRFLSEFLWHFLSTLVKKAFEFKVTRFLGFVVFFFFFFFRRGGPSVPLVLSGPFIFSKCDYGRSWSEAL